MEEGREERDILAFFLLFASLSFCLSHFFLAFWSD